MVVKSGKVFSRNREQDREMSTCFRETGTSARRRGRVFVKRVPGLPNLVPVFRKRVQVSEKGGTVFRKRVLRLTLAGSGRVKTGSVVEKAGSVLSQAASVSKKR